MLGGGEQQIAEAAEHERTNRLLLVISDPHIVQPLAGEHIEMIEPEIDHDLMQLPRAQQRSEDAPLAGVAQDDPHTFALGPFQLRIGLEAAQIAQRSVKLAQLHRVEP